MARYIDAEELISHIKSTMDMQDLYLPIHFIAAINNVETADVQEVKHAEWECCNKYENVYMCTGEDGCGITIMLNEGSPIDNYYYFCPNCGARMDKEVYY